MFVRFYCCRCSLSFVLRINTARQVDLREIYLTPDLTLLFRFY